MDRPQLLTKLIKAHNPLITATPTLTTSSNNSSDASGLYVSYDTNEGYPTYYFRGSLTNNYVSFANKKWKIIRINEDGTVRLKLNGYINSSYNDTYDTFDKMYYSNGSKAKIEVDSWYQTNIVDKGYDSYVSTGVFCEQAKVKTCDETSGNATMKIYTEYIPNFKCETDGNGKGVLKLKAGLITYDEVVHAGGYYFETNKYYYLYSNRSIWTMSPSGFGYPHASNWHVYSTGYVNSIFVDTVSNLSPVINLNADVLATGTGTSGDPYLIQTN